MNYILPAMIYSLLFSASGLVHGADLSSSTHIDSTRQEFTAKIIEVLDGDTVSIRLDGRRVKIRLAEIDAPEKAQIFGETSKQSLSDMVLGKKVKVVSRAFDQYGRMVAHLSVDGLDVNAEQIRRGMAWEYFNFHDEHGLSALQKEAREVPRGLWAQSKPIPPWEWRQQNDAEKAGGLQEKKSVENSATERVQPDAVCGKKKRCSKMSSCEEARFYLEHCGVKSLDRDGDGIPCEKLCAH